MTECAARHPELDRPCEATGVHVEHAAFDRGWHAWPNDDYEPPRDARADLSRAAKAMAADRLVGWGGPDRAEHLTDQQSEVLTLLREAGSGGYTHEELIAAGRLLGLSQTDSSIRTRCRELVDLRLVCESGMRRRSSRGNPSRVWVARTA